MSTKEEAYQKIQDLVTRFEEQFESYKKTEYNETLTRRDFIDPFFKALGWDIDNSVGYAEAYREVIHEERIKIGNASKAPDYTFRLNGGKKLFFVEAKKPSVSIKDDISVSYQIRRYGWNAKLAISIITDFEEFAVYDCTKKPNPTDKTGIARIKYINFKDYIKEFDYLWNIFSKEQVLKGSFDRYIKSDTVKKGTSTVDREFLASLDSWRTYLATSISLKNKQLDEDEINYAVQLIIDRLIFLRIAEDRRVEQYGQMKFAVNQKGDAWQNLFFIFKKADEKYNSGLFDFKKDTISESLHIDNKVIKTIINEMYYPSPYEFSQIPVEILGSAYEQFLGKVIRITPSHHAKIEEKPEVRKAGGVYYTPQYIVDYIVKNTVGKLIEGKTPKQISDIKICDPACGSGSFLIGAYQYLLDYHKNFYTDNGTRVGKKDSPVTPQGNLTAAEKKRILLNNIYGVDIDVNAVEVTKLSLLIKCMEGETATTIEQQQKLWHERILPTLDNNIKCGNSLVDTDFYDSFIDFGEQKKIKPFNWIKAFPEVFKKPHVKNEKENLKELADKTKFHASKALEYANMLDAQINHIAEPDSKYSEINGFDVVIGNPPYGATFSESELTFIKNKYKTSVWRGESYLLFIEKGLKLLSLNGKLGFIIPDTILNLGFTASSRNYILQNSKLNEIVLLPSNVFSGATVDTIILLTQKDNFSSTFHKTDVTINTFNKKSSITQIIQPERNFTVNTEVWHNQNVFNLQTNDKETELISKIENGKKKISDIAVMYSGIKAYEVGKGNPPQTETIRNVKPFTSANMQTKDWNPFFDGKHIGRYQLLWKENNWIHYGKWLAAPRNPENFIDEKILIRKITGKTIIATYIPYTSYCNTLLFVLKVKDNSFSYATLTGILNSTLIGWYFRKKFQISDSDTFPQIMIRDILEFPIPDISNKSGSNIGLFVEQLIKLHEELKTTKLPDKIEQIQARIEYTDDKINQLVYQLYDLTEEEISIIEKQ
jgi:type I restriction-modification system DNA methylase subunit